MTTTKKEKLLDELNRLKVLLNKYGHRWNDTPSHRMTVWASRYNEIREEYPAIWSEYCNKQGYCEEHDAFDCMA